MTDTNGALGLLFDILTAGSPLKTKPVREAVKVVSEALIAFPDPSAKGFGVALSGLVKVFEKRAEQKSRRRKK